MEMPLELLDPGCFETATALDLLRLGVVRNEELRLCYDDGRKTVGVEYR